MMLYHPFKHTLRRDSPAPRPGPRRQCCPKASGRDVAVLRALLGLADSEEDDRSEHYSHGPLTHHGHRQYRHGYEEDELPWYANGYARHHQQQRRPYWDDNIAWVKAEAQENVRMATEAAIRAERRASDLERQLARRSSRVNAIVDRFQQRTAELQAREAHIAEAERRQEARERAFAQREEAARQREMDVAQWKADVRQREQASARASAVKKIQRRWRQYRATRPDVSLRKALAILDRLGEDLGMLLGVDIDTKHKTEGLIQQLEAADAVVSDGNAEVRRRRKQHVRRVMQALDALDSADETSSSDGSEATATEDDSDSGCDEQPQGIDEEASVVDALLEEHVQEGHTEQDTEASVQPHLGNENEDVARPDMDEHASIAIEDAAATDAEDTVEDALDAGELSGDVVHVDAEAVHDEQLEANNTSDLEPRGEQVESASAAPSDDDFVVIE